jgi:hypothetical protein
VSENLPHAASNANVSTLGQYFSMRETAGGRISTQNRLADTQWEIGYRGYPLKLLEKRLNESGWSILSSRAQ